MYIVKNATLYIGTGEIIENGSFLVKDGKFSEINSDETVDCKTLDMQGKTITPGLIDVHTHLGVFEDGVGGDGHDFNEMSSPVTPHIRAIDGINPNDRAFMDARKGGVTTVQIMPGSANVIGGEMLIVKTYGNIVDRMAVRTLSGLKAATGENPKKVYGSKGKMPMTRMGVAATLRKKLVEGQNYLEKLAAGKGERDLELEIIGKVLKREIPLRVHAHRSEDIATVLRIKKEFNLEITIEHCTEGHLIADYIAEHDVKVSVGPTMSSRSKLELSEMGWHTLPALEAAGVPVSITTDHPVVPIEHLMTSAIYAVKDGNYSEESALKAITINAAKHLGIENQVGSIEVGKDADFVVWDGDPFDLRTEVVETYIHGEVVYG
ncbi:amidohydrolase [Pseudogracilibacillus auburnensis]|uniref:amidohydrolase n=1 Tax=Pseudogracilibacillus auburnensis TaxID=1494959 RepID=UPI001A97029A|nr:amidohydrolase [Pseudogracilibacillus auburnensis]MBO1005808.1 amidohydrolase [Pseudogracilibacillus auburnensis]